MGNRCVCGMLLAGCLALAGCSDEDTKVASDEQEFGGLTVAPAADPAANGAGASSAGQRPPQGNMPADFAPPQVQSQGLQQAPAFVSSAESSASDIRGRDFAPPAAENRPAAEPAAPPASKPFTQEPVAEAADRPGEEPKEDDQDEDERGRRREIARSGDAPVFVVPPAFSPAVTPGTGAGQGAAVGPLAGAGAEGFGLDAPADAAAFDPMGDLAGFGPSYDDMFDFGSGTGFGDIDIASPGDYGFDSFGPGGETFGGGFGGHDAALPPFPGDSGPMTPPSGDMGDAALPDGPPMDFPAGPPAADDFKIPDDPLDEALDDIHDDGPPLTPGFPDGPPAGPIPGPPPGDDLAPPPMPDDGLEITDPIPPPDF